MPKIPSISTKSKGAHVSKAKFGMGDFYGSGVKQPLGKMRDGIGSNPVSKKKLGKPPKSLA